MEFISTFGKSFTFDFASKIIFVGILGVSYVLLCSIYSELKLFRNKDFIFLGFSNVLIIGLAKLNKFDKDRSFYPTLTVVIASYYPLFGVLESRFIWHELCDS